MRVGQVDTGRYTFAVCRGAADDNCARSGHHAIDVQGERLWGFLGGFGMSAFPHATRVEIERISTDNYTLSRSDDLRLATALPVIATFYPFAGARRQMMRNRADLGVGLGLNMLRPHREYYAGVNLGGGPAGVFVGYALLRSSVANAPDGTELESTGGLPNVGSVYGTSNVFDHGFLVAVTFDFDVFRRLYHAVTDTGIPGVSSGEDSQ